MNRAFSKLKFDHWQLDGRSELEVRCRDDSHRGKESSEGYYISSYTSDIIFTNFLYISAGLRSIYFWTTTRMTTNMNIGWVEMSDKMAFSSSFRFVWFDTLRFLRCTLWSLLMSATFTCVKTLTENQKRKKLSLKNIIFVRLQFAKNQHLLISLR